jgi:hypothetical protein
MMSPEGIAATLIVIGEGLITHLVAEAPSLSRQPDQWLILRLNHRNLRGQLQVNQHDQPSVQLEK